MCDLSEDSQDKLDTVRNIISNCEELRNKEGFEEEWIHVYLHSSCFKGIPFEDIKKVFDACDKEKLQKLHTIPHRGRSNFNPFTVFRGCVGGDFRPGMSWTTDLYQAIKYPKRSKLYNFYGDDTNKPCSVWVALVEKEEIYCYLEHYEPEFIVCPKKYWKIDIPQDLFEQYIGKTF